ncbi:MAG TPA: TetR/AcrR family transcriptional regulator [Chitinophagaceae bacterium]|nr:TetR/AcrR family transcriptional regulator [Chitinophagaceae bacterium]
MKVRDENKTDQIYEATLKLVKASGLAGITMQAVAREAGLATGTLYIYFKNKDALIISLFDRCVKSSARDFFKNYNPQSPFKEGFRIIWENIVRHRVTRFDESIFIEQCFHSPFIDEDTKTTLRKMFAPLVQLLDRGKNEGWLKAIDTFWLLGFLIGTINEIAKRVTYFNRKLTPDVLEANFQLCWDGIKQ